MSFDFIPPPHLLNHRMPLNRPLKIRKPFTLPKRLIHPRNILRRHRQFIPMIPLRHYHFRLSSFRIKQLNLRIRASNIQTPARRRETDLPLISLDTPLYSRCSREGFSSSVMDRYRGTGGSYCAMDHDLIRDCV